MRLPIPMLHTGQGQIYQVRLPWGPLLLLRDIADRIVYKNLHMAHQFCIQ